MDLASFRRACDSAYATAYREWLLPLWERGGGAASLRQRVQYLERSQWLSREELELAQTSALARLLSYAGNYVPYYRELFRAQRFDPRSIKSRADLVQLPLLTPEIVEERYDDLVDPAHRGAMHRKGVKGSPRKPFRLEQSAESDLWRRAVELRNQGWAGYRPGGKTLYLRDSASVHPLGTKKLVEHALKRETIIDATPQDVAVRQGALETLRRAKPELIVCDARAGAQFARWINDEGRRDWADIPVICRGQGLSRADRRALGAAFGPHVFESYVSLEALPLGAECESHQGLHVSEEYLMVEVLHHGRPASAAAGERGDVVVTDLHNLAMPMIRYANGDQAVRGSERRCACGRELARLSQVTSRDASVHLVNDERAELRTAAAS